MKPYAEGTEATLSLRDLFSFVARGAVMAVVFAALAAVGAYVMIDRRPPVFRAEATLLLAQGSSAVAQFGVSAVTAPAIDPLAYGVAASSDPVLRDALTRMETESPTTDEIRTLRRSIATSTEFGARDSSLLFIEARGSSAQLAVDRANAVASAVVAWDRGRATTSLERVISTLEQQIDALSEQVRSLQAIDETTDQAQIDGLIRLRAEQQQQLAYARALVVSSEGRLSVLQDANSTVRQTAPRPLSASVIAAVVAALAVYAMLLVRLALNTRIRSVDDIATVTGLPVLAEFPSAGRADVGTLREASSYLRTNLLFKTADEEPKIFMVTSSVQHEGKSTVARNLAESFVRYGYRTLLVDCDLRVPSVAKSYKLSSDVSASATTKAWLKDSTEPHQVVRVELDEGRQLDVVPQFAPVKEAPELLGRGFRSALEYWRKYDVLVIDTPPVLAVADALMVGPHCTGTVFVVDRNLADRRKLTAAVEALQRIGVQVLGIVSNKDGAAGDRAGYGATYGSPYVGSPVRSARATVRVRKS